MYFQCKLDELRKDKKEAIQGINNVEEIKQEKIKDAIKSIEDKYNLKK